MFREIFDFIKTLFTEKRETLFGILIVTMLCFAVYFMYEQFTKVEDVSAKDIENLKVMHNEEIKTLRNERVLAENELLARLSECNRDCHRKMDSIEEVYYYKFKEFEQKVNKIENKVNTIIQQ